MKSIQNPTQLIAQLDVVIGSDQYIMSSTPITVDYIFFAFSRIQHGPGLQWARFVKLPEKPEGPRDNSGGTGHRDYS